MTNRILSIGEAMVEISSAGAPDLYRIGVAGDTLNTAWYLRRLLPSEWHVDYMSRVGQGPFSQKMVDFLSAEGIGTDYVGRDDIREIGLYAISLCNGERSFSYWRDTSAARCLADDPSELSAAIKGRRMIYASGITFAILPDSGRAALLAAFDEARTNGTQIVFDTNLRPRLWADAQSMRYWTEQAARASDVILPSFDDERDHFGDVSSAATLARYLEFGAREVIVKAAGEPVHYGLHTGQTGVINVTRDHAVDTTAAGDSFNAGYLAARLQGADQVAAIHAGHALSRKVILYSGALVHEAVA